MWQLSNMIYLLISYRIMLQCKFCCYAYTLSVCRVGVYTTVHSQSNVLIVSSLLLASITHTLTQTPFCRSPTGITSQ